MKYLHDKINKVFPLAIMGFVLFLGCETNKPAQKNMNHSIVYHYSDGSGNAYSIKPNSIDYDPVSPKQSSSGFYSGGEPVKNKTITPEQYAMVQSLIKEALSNSSVHMKHRVKMSGWIQFKVAGKMKSCILKPGAEEQKKIESLLKKLKSK